MEVGTGSKSDEEEAREKNNCEVYEKCHGVLRV